jgi:chromosome segregation ATPase
LPIQLESLKSEREHLKDGLRELEAEQRKVETELKALRQREIQIKREIEALSTLIEINEAREEKKTAEQTT